MSVISLVSFLSPTSVKDERSWYEQYSVVDEGC